MYYGLGQHFSVRLYRYYYLLGPIPRHVCDAVIHQLHDNLRMYLNFHSIYPYLNSHGLLDSLDQSILTYPETTIEKKVDIIIGWLPKCKQSDYLTPFIACLRESSKQAGNAHLELVDQFEKLIKAELHQMKGGILRNFFSFTRPREHEVTTVHGMFCIFKMLHLNVLLV